MGSPCIAYLGIEGSYSHQACQEIFPKQEYRGLLHFHDIFEEVEADRASAAVVPVDNALSGRIDGIYQELSKVAQRHESRLNIVQEYILPIHHCLLVPDTAANRLALGAEAGLDKSEILAKIEEVYSHPQGFAQCQEFRGKFLTGAKECDTTDTASAARAVSAGSGDKLAAAISSKMCAKLYNLLTIAENIEDDPGNATRFLVISKKSFEGSEPTAPALTTILFQTKHEPGSLVGALAAFSERGINLTKLETYMASKERRKPTFYVDVGEHFYADRMIAAIAQFKRHVEYWKVLGTYPASPQRGIVSGFLAV